MKGRQRNLTKNNSDVLVKGGNYEIENIKFLLLRVNQQLIIYE